MIKEWIYISFRIIVRGLVCGFFFGEENDCIVVWCNSIWDGY